MNWEEISYIIFSFVLVATFIAVFFFTYVSTVEEDIIKTQIENVIADFTKSSNIIFTPDDKKEIGKVLNSNLKYPDMKDADESARKNNDDLIKKSIIVFCTLIGVGLLITILLWFKFRYSFLDMIRYSLIIVCLIAMTELLFVTFIIKNYRLIDPNYVYYLFAKNFKEYASS